MRNYIQFDNLLMHPIIKNISSKDIETQIKNYKLCFTHVYDSENINFDPFLKTFYKMIIENKVIPKQIDFVNEYIKTHITNKKFDDFYKTHKTGVQSKLLRAYPSYVRDIHFGKKIFESNLFDDVIYNPRLDICQGIDLLIINNCQIFGVHLFVDSKRANYWRARKDNRHPEQLCKNIDYTVNLNMYNVGDFKLYGKKQVDELYNILKKSI